MSLFVIYGKRTRPWIDEHNKYHEPDKKFAALDGKGMRVTKLENAETYVEYEDAQEIIDKRGAKNGVEFQIRRVND